MNLEKLAEKERRSRKYAEEFFNEEWELEGLFKADVGILEDVLKKKGKLLDVAMGPGRHVKLFAGKGFRVWGNDFNRHMIETANRSVKKGHAVYTNHDMRDMKSLKSDFFDYVICMGASLGSIYRQSERQKAVGEFARVAKPESLVIIHAHNALEVSEPSDVVGIVRMARDSILREGFEFGDVVYYHSRILRRAYMHWFVPWELERLMKRAGLKVVRRYYLKGPDQDRVFRGGLRHFRAGGFVFVGKKIPGFRGLAKT